MRASQIKMQMIVVPNFLLGVTLTECKCTSPVMLQIWLDTTKCESRKQLFVRNVTVFPEMLFIMASLLKENHKALQECMFSSAK